MNPDRNSLPPPDTAANDAAQAELGIPASPEPGRVGVALELDHHGDQELAPGLIDLAVNVRHAPLPSWLAGPLVASLLDLGRYPDPTTARAALAARHRRTPDEVLLTAGAAQAFTLLAQATRGYLRPIVVHPQFTEPEVALRAAGHRVDRVLLPAEHSFELDQTLVPTDADLVMIGNPTNPTSVLHPAATIATLARPGRLLVVDEAFADTTPGEPQSLAGRSDIPGLVVIRSLTKTWALAGLRVGYLLAAPPIVRALSAVQPLWPVSTPALAAATACASAIAVAAEVELARRLAADRAHLVDGLQALPGVEVIGEPASSFVLVRLQGADRIRVALRARGYAVRRGDTFPGLGTDWLRIAVRDPAITDGFLTALSDALTTIANNSRPDPRGAQKRPNQQGTPR